MTKRQVCEKFQISESYLTKNFNVAKERIRKKHGILIEKIGRGQKAVYEIIQDNSRAMTIYQEQKKSVLINHDSMTDMPINMDFAVFLGIIMTPFEVFRGSYNDFLKYIQMEVNPKNKEDLKEALKLLQEKDYIHYAIDKTNEEYFFAGIYRKVQEELSLGIDMVRTCRKLQLQHKKKSWIPLLKCWLGIKYLYIQSPDQPYTQKDLGFLTGLNNYQIKECTKILERDNVFKSDKAYLGYAACIGKVVTLNGLHEGNQL